jgi:hypothetical protein
VLVVQELNQYYQLQTQHLPDSLGKVHPLIKA